MRARIWAAKACLALASVLLREPEPSKIANRILPDPEDDEDNSPLPGVVMTAAAREMLADGERWAAILLEREMAAKRKETPKPLRGSTQARIEEARNRRAT